METIGQLKKAFLATHPDADKTALNKAGEKFRRCANNLNDVRSYIIECGEDGAIERLDEYYKETLAQPDGKNTDNRNWAKGRYR